MDAKIAVAHYPEGAGHATRMLAIATELEALGAEVSISGGGPGTAFVSLNGYDAFEPTPVDYIDAYQGGSIRQVLTGCVLPSARRVADYVAWLRASEPDALVTDDMFAAMAAFRTGVPLYVLKHDMPGLYRDRLERAGAALHTTFQLAAAREFFYPAVWPPSAVDPPTATRVPPVSLEGDRHEIGWADVICVPSEYSDFDGIAAELDRQGYDVLHVGDDDWEAVPSLLPYVRGADTVVCSGYSTIMDAAVGGTPCVIYPETDEQEAVAEWIDSSDTTGFSVARRAADVLDAVAAPPDPPSYENGAGEIAATVVDDLRRTDAGTAASSTPAGRRTADGGSGRGLTPARRRFADSIRSQLLGRGVRSLGAAFAAVALALLVAQLVGGWDAFTLVERTLPTYAGSVTELFLLEGAVLVTLGALGARVRAGLVGSALLAGGPVFGWAAVHSTVPMATPYAATFPVEMAVLYGGVFGSLGHLAAVHLERATAHRAGRRLDDGSSPSDPK